MLTTTERESTPIVIVRDAWLGALGSKPYREVWELQKALVDRRAEDKIPDGLILVEHDPVATLGRRGSREDVLDPELEILEVERGGEATYHGPGQLVGYPILRLPDRLEVKRLVTDLEEVLLRTCADFGIDATREGPERGVWVGGKKIASIGLAVHRNVTFHGFAHNVTTDLREFLKIRPCGHDGGIMTSMEKLLGHSVDLEDVKAGLRPDLHPGLADLQHLRHPAAVHRLAGGRDCTAQQIGEFLEHREGFRVPEAVAAAHDHVGLFRTESALPGEFLKVRESRVDVRWPELDGLVDDLARPGRIVRRGDEHIPAYRGHLGPMLLAEDVGQALPAETGADHVEVSLRVDVELDAVRRQAGLEDRMEAASQVPSVLRGAV